MKAGARISLLNCAEQWAKWEPNPRARANTHLFWYRDHVRAVLTRNDSDGARLSILRGFEEQAMASGYLDSAALVTIGMIPGKSAAGSLSMPNLDVLPRAAVNGITGAIEWEFGCALQQGVYELMRHRWRAKVCSEVQNVDSILLPTKRRRHIARRSATRRKNGSKRSTIGDGKAASAETNESIRQNPEGGNDNASCTLRQSLDS